MSYNIINTIYIFVSNGCCKSIKHSKNKNMSAAENAIAIIKKRLHSSIAYSQAELNRPKKRPKVVNRHVGKKKLTIQTSFPDNKTYYTPNCPICGCLMIWQQNAENVICPQSCAPYKRLKQLLFEEASKRQKKRQIWRDYMKKYIVYSGNYDNEGIIIRFLETGKHPYINNTCDKTKPTCVLDSIPDEGLVAIPRFLRYFNKLN